MILGLGLDLIERDRVARLMRRYGERFLARILTPAELGSMHGTPDGYVASRIACKEAAFKALGTGCAKGVTWKQIEIRTDSAGAPSIHFRGVARRRIVERGATDAWVSLTHAREHAAAVVVLEARGSPRGSGREAEEESPGD